MYKLLRMAVLSLPLAGGMAYAQGSGTNGSAGAVDGTQAPMGTQGTTDTRTPMQKRAGELDDTTAAPAVPGDATKPRSVPETAPMSDRAGLPESADKPTTDKKDATGQPSDSSSVPKSDLRNDQNESDK